MRNTISIIFVGVTLFAGFHLCFGDGPPLSITTSNQNVILTWPLANTNWVLVETGGLDTSYVSNDVIYITPYRKRIIQSNTYLTNGDNFYVVLPIDFSTTNKFYMLRTNDLPPPPQSPH
jgi:hypothetical protein